MTKSLIFMCFLTVVSSQSGLAEKSALLRPVLTSQTLSACSQASEVVASAQESTQVKQSHDPLTLFTAERELTRWGDFSIFRIDNQLFLQSEGTERTLLYTDKKQHCSVRARFLNRTLVYLETCAKGTFVADLKGIVRYKLPNFKYSDIAPNRTGTLFAVLERGRSMWHEIGQESYDKMRILVYSTEDGKKLLEHKWSQAAGEDVPGERIELSDDGATLFLHRSTGTATFSINVGSSH